MERFPMCGRPLIAAITLGALVVPAGAQAESRDPVWENERMTVTRVSVERGATLASGGDRILVYFSADADGRMPAEAVWHPAGGPAIQNLGPNRLEALVIELKDAPTSGTRGTPPETLAGSGVTVTTLIDNPRVLVLKHRYAQQAYGAREHFHADDVLLVYLRGGYTWPLDGSYEPERVRQGDIDVVPPLTFHTVLNAGGDPLELLVVIPR